MQTILREDYIFTNIRIEALEKQLANLGKTMNSNSVTTNNMLEILSDAQDQNKDVADVVHNLLHKVHTF